MDNKGLVSIGVEQIYQHPDNPRRDLGDLTELTESIKKKGVMQNLTVIPGHWDNKQEWHEDGYTLLIGHRRCAAAKSAGLTELPCRIVEEMSKKDQVSTMLEENMQRNDLTIWEQANGFQMMLDLGDTEEQIAEKTGFSKTTIRHRLNIAKLNQKELQKKEKDEGFQLSLKDLYELEKIPDVKVRNKILKESTSSNNLAQKSRTALAEIKKKENEKAYIKICKAEGIQPAPEGSESERYSGKWEILKEFELSEEAKEKTGCKTRAAQEELFYVVYWGRTFAIIKKKGKEKKEPTKEELKQKAKDKKKKEIKAMQKIMSVERVDFVHLAIEQKFKPGDEKTEDVLVKLFDMMVKCGCYMSESTLVKFVTGESSMYSKSEEEVAEYEKKRAGIGLIYKMLIYVANGVGEKDLTEWNGTYYKGNGETIMKFDEILALFGFTYSKEEFYKLTEGTHELFQDE